MSGRQGEQADRPILPSLPPPDPASVLSPSDAAALVAKRRGLGASFTYAFNGVFRTLCTQRNMKIHWISGLAVMLVGMALSLDIASRSAVLFCVFVVMCMEVLNTAFEAFVDLHVRQYARTAMIAKDAAAAAVLILAIGAVVVFADILLHHWQMIMASGASIVRTIAAGVPLLIITGLVLFLRRVMAVMVLLGALGIGLLTFLAYYSRDEIFSLGALGFVLGALVARFREPRLL